VVSDRKLATLSPEEKRSHGEEKLDERSPLEIKERRGEEGGRKVTEEDLSGLGCASGVKYNISHAQIAIGWEAGGRGGGVGGHIV